MNSAKDSFPFFTAHQNVVYVDNAATTQKPQSVITLAKEHYSEHNANAGRGSYALSSKLAQQIEKVRQKVANFINVKPNEIAFTSGATDSIHKAIFSLGFSYLKNGDEILYSPDDHKSFILPWFQIQKVLRQYGVNIVLTPYRYLQSGAADIDDIFAKVTSRTKVIAITHIHNTYGADSDIAKLKSLRDKGVLIVVDVSQSVGHVQVDVKEIGADIAVFSGHKMFALNGSGVLFVDDSIQLKLEPLFVGGGESAWLSAKTNSVQSLSFCSAIESGTLNAAAILSLSPAIEYIESIGYETIESHMGQLTIDLISGLSAIEGIQFAPGPKYWTCAGGFGIVSFSIDGFNSGEVGFALDQQNIMVRTGQFCRTNEMTSRDDDLIRVSMHIYNTKDDVSKLISALRSIRFDTIAM